MFKVVTGKYLSEALIFASTNPKYDDWLFIELVCSIHENSKLNPGFRNCFWHSEQFMYTTCSELGIFMYWTRNSMNNFLSYCGLVDTGISASEKDLPV